MIRRPPRSTRTDTLFPTRRSSDLSRKRGNPPLGSSHLPNIQERDFNLREDDDGEEALMAKKHIPAEAGDRGRLEIVFDGPHILGPLFGYYDQNLVALENLLTDYLSPRANHLQTEAKDEDAARP